MHLDVDASNNTFESECSSATYIPNLNFDEGLLVTWFSSTSDIIMTTQVLSDTSFVKKIANKFYTKWIILLVHASTSVNQYNDYCLVKM